MSHSLQFEKVISFHKDAPALFLHLIGPAGRLEVLVTLDTGSQFSLFRGSHAQEDIGIDLLSGEEIALSSLGGVVKGYLHRVELEIEGFRFDAQVVFSLNPIPRELLGRHSIFDRTTWGVRESRREIYFSPQP